MSRRIIIFKSRLQYLYIKKRLSARKIADILSCEKTVILNRLRKYNIPIRHPKKRLIISREQLDNLYIKEKFSIYGIAKKFHCSPGTIYQNLKLHRIQTRPLKKLNLTRKILKEFYINKNFSLSQIAKIYKCSSAGVLKKMRQHRIPTRTLSEASTKHPRIDFVGNDLEKAYIIGFRIGDLRVRKERNLIKIGCGTTKVEQIQLIKSLFKEYGPIWISKKSEKSAAHIDYSLNLSFRFLLPKYNSIPKWILINKRNFLAFLAGYTDAEGNIGVYTGRARFRIRSYDKEILRDIDIKLKSLGIKSLFSLDKKAHIDKRGVRHNKDCWVTAVNERESLLKLINLIEFFLRHKKRRRDLLKAKKNIILRLKK